MSAADLTTTDNYYISYDGKAPKEILVSYGWKNGTQSYGGGTVLFNPSENKPCHLPVYRNYNYLIGTVYIFNDPSNQRLVLQKDTYDKSLRIIAFYR